MLTRDIQRWQCSNFRKSVYTSDAKGRPEHVVISYMEDEDECCG
jgi:hypothetical protein